MSERKERGDDHMDGGEHVAHERGHVCDMRYVHVGSCQITLCGVTPLHYSLSKAVHVQYLLSLAHYTGRQGSVCTRAVPIPQNKELVITITL